MYHVGFFYRVLQPSSALHLGVCSVTSTTKLMPVSVTLLASLAPQEPPSFLPHLLHSNKGQHQFFSQPGEPLTHSRSDHHVIDTYRITPTITS